MLSRLIDFQTLLKAFKNIFLLILISTAIGFGSTSFLNAPVVADDLNILVQGMAHLSDPTSSPWQLLRSNIIDNTGYHHVMPMVGVIFFLQNCAIYGLTFLVNDLSLLSSIFRMGWHLFSLVALSYFLNKSIYFNSASKNRFNNFIRIYALVGFGFISFTQIHSLWKEAPIISYGVVGSGVAGMGFIFLARIFDISNSDTVRLKYSLVTGLIGVIALLTYEMFTAPLAVGILTYISFAIKNKTYNNFSKFLKTSFCWAVPLFLLVSTQFLRILNPEKNYYDGTQFGDPSYIFPNFVTSFYGSLPMTYVDLATKHFGVLDIYLNQSYFYLGAAAVSLVLAFGRKNNNDRMHRPFQNYVYFALISTWILSTLIFMFTSKYQNELDVEIGRVYMFYSFGNLAVIGVAVIWLLRSQPTVQAILVSIIIITGLYTNIYNKALIKDIQTQPAVVIYSEMLSTLNSNEINSVKNCELVQNLRSSNLPDYYKNIFIPNFLRIYYQTNERTFCPS